MRVVAEFFRARPAVDIVVRRLYPAARLSGGNPLGKEALVVDWGLFTSDTTGEVYSSSFRLSV